jgi:hypothetical protein
MFAALRWTAAESVSSANVSRSFFRTVGFVRPLISIELALTSLEGEVELLLDEIGTLLGQHLGRKVSGPLSQSPSS